MRYLIELYLKYRFWLIFVFLEVVSMVTLIKFNKYQGSVYFTTANAVSGAWYSFTSGISSFFDMQAENERLEHENEMLRKRLNDLRSGMKEEDNTVDILTEKNRNLRDYHYVGAHIINATLNRANNVLTIDRGEEDGVKESAGVVCSSGVVGVSGPDFKAISPVSRSRIRIRLLLFHSDSGSPSPDILAFHSSRSDLVNSERISAYIFFMPSDCA